MGKVAALALALLIAPSPARAQATTAAGPPAIAVRLFVDLECPHSRQAWPVYRNAVAAAPGAQVFVHHLPLSRHPHARAAALAALAARQQGRESAFIDRLLQDPVPDDAALHRAAVAAGLDVQAFDRDRAGAALADALDRERLAGLAFGIRATPSALVNGRGIAGVPPVPALQRALAAQTAAAAAIPADVQADPEREGLLRDTPEFVLAFDALRSARMPAPQQRTPTPTGRLGERWRVTVQADERATGPATAPVTAVWFCDPTVPWQVAQQRELLALSRSGVRTVVKHLARAASAGAIDAPATAVALHQAQELARHVDARPGTLFLNGRRWLGLPQDSGIAAAVAELARETQPLTAAGLDATQAYARLVASGAWRSDEELDLLAPDPLGDRSRLPAFGTGPVTVTLLVDFASPHSRAAFAMLRRYVGHPELPVRLQMGSLASAAAGCGSTAGSAFTVAARMGQGLPFAERLFDSAAPNDGATVAALAKKLRLPVAAFQKELGGADARAVADSVCRLVERLERAEDPVIQLGNRLYTGPLDEARIERALRFVTARRKVEQHGGAGP